MKQAPVATDVDGEEFFSALPRGYKVYPKDDGGPFQRFLPHIEARDKKLKNLPQAQGNYRDYDDTDTVNQS